MGYLELLRSIMYSNFQWVLSVSNFGAEVIALLELLHYLNLDFEGLLPSLWVLDLGLGFGISQLGDLWHLYAFLNRRLNLCVYVGI